MSKVSNVKSAAPIGPVRKGFSGLPFFGDLVALWRMVRDPQAKLGMKALAFAALIYVVSPIDAFPEAIAPFIAWVDDVGLVLMLRFLLDRQLSTYRYPLFESRPLAVHETSKV